jgi:hypothetical protein
MIKKIVIKNGRITGKKKGSSLGIPSEDSKNCDKKVYHGLGKVNNDNMDIIIGRNLEESFMNEQELLNRILILEYHQKLLVKLLNNPTLNFYKLIIEYGITEHETQMFFSLCSELTIKMEEQKAEGFVYFHPLFEEFSTSLPPKLDPKEVIHACVTQQLYERLFHEFKKYI